MNSVIASLVSVILIAVAYVPYFRGMLAKKVRPNAITWLGWAITTSAMGILQLFSGGGWVVLPIAIIVLVDIGVFVLALKNGGRADIVKIDIACFIASMVSFVFWLATRQSDIAMILITASQFIAFIPTIRKVWNKPTEENSFTWGVNSFRYVLMIFTVSEFSVATISNSIWWAAVYGGATILILSRRKLLSNDRVGK